MEEFIPHSTDTENTRCKKCNKDEVVHFCDNCKTIGTYNCNQHWQCPLGELLVYADYLPWNSSAGPGYYCQNCGTPPR